MENMKDVYTQTISYEELLNEIYQIYMSNNDRMNLIIDTEIISESGSGSEEYVESNIYDKLELDNPVLTTDFIDIIYNEKSQPILIGSTLPSFDKKIFKLGEKEIKFQGLTTKGLKNKNLLIEYAMLYLNAPYLWGGRSPFGIDCSGLTQMTYRLQGTEIPRDAQQQAELGKTLSFIEESQPGDLAFFDNSEGKIIHVGLILENNYIIHASGKVRIDRLDQQGIYNNEIRSHTHKLRLIKSII